MRLDTSYSYVSDEGEVFQVKKSSQSRRLIKQKKAERKKKEKKGRGGAGDGAADVGGEGDENAPRLLKETQQPEVNLIEEGIMFKDTIPKPKASAQQTWTLSGREAEALHLEEEDQDDDDDQQQQSEPLRDILQSGFIPIHGSGKTRFLPLLILVVSHSQVLLNACTFYCSGHLIHDLFICRWRNPGCRSDT